MSDKIEFQVGDRVKYGSAEGVVISKIGARWDLPLLVNFVGASSKLAFTNCGKRDPDIEGAPRLELIERAKKKRTVTLWRWERWNDGDKSLHQTVDLFAEREGWEGWTKVPGSERVIEIEEE